MTIPDQIQNYAPFRKTAISKEVVRDLSTLRSPIVVRDTVLFWIQIVSAWTVAALYPAWWVILLCLPIIGTRFYGLFIIAHDGLHRRLFEDIRLNDLWNDVFILGSVFSITRLNRWNHMEHHQRLALPGDPDRYKYISGNKRDRLGLLAVLTGIPYVANVVKNVLMKRGPQSSSKPRPDGYHTRDILILGVWQSGLIGGLTYLFGWWGYIVLWLFPVYLFTHAANMIRVFLEHSVIGPDENADRTKRLITYSSFWLERIFLAPNNMNYHATHHLWPSIPYYNLPKANQMLRVAAPGSLDLFWRKSYFGYLFEYASSIPWRA